MRWASITILSSSVEVVGPSTVVRMWRVCVSGPSPASPSWFESHARRVKGASMQSSSWTHRTTTLFGSPLRCVTLTVKPFERNYQSRIAFFLRGFLQAVEFQIVAF